MGKYADWLSSAGAPTRPGWLLGPNGRALARQSGGALDTLNDLLLQGLLARFPTKGKIYFSGRFVSTPD
jgi:hypothetical protein